MRRRTFLAALAAAPFVSLATRPARAAMGTKIKALARDVTGTTFTLGLEHAPFAGTGYLNDNVIVFVPAQFRYRSEEGLATLVHFHGHNTTADRAIVSHQLREQLADSKQNALLIVPQLAVMAADSSCGNLESPGAFGRMVSEAVLSTAHDGRATLGESGFPAGARVGTVCMSAHSGGYHAAACALRAGGLEVRETYLFDALYAEIEPFRDWVISRKGEPLHRRHKLVSYFTEGGTTEANNDALRGQLDKAGVMIEAEIREGELSRHDLSHAEAVFVRTGVFHSNVTWETNSLRDCLFASALPRHLGSSWFAKKNEAREIERRR
jgi:hypothetical protein